MHPHTLALVVRAQVLLSRISLSPAYPYPDAEQPDAEFSLDDAVVEELAQCEATVTCFSVDFDGVSHVAQSLP